MSLWEGVSRGRRRPRVAVLEAGQAGMSLAVKAALGSHGTFPTQLEGMLVLGRKASVLRAWIRDGHITEPLELQPTVYGATVNGLLLVGGELQEAAEVSAQHPLLCPSCSEPVLP